jgi:hypothetical protein
MADLPVPRPPSRRPHAVVAGVLCVAATAAGVGWLYLLRDVGALGFGPSVTGALPLQRLVGADAQPLARLVVTWVPAGLVAGAALAALTGLGRRARVAVAGVAAWVVLAATGAAADAVTANERLTQHLTGQLRHPGLWVAVAFVCAGAVIVRSRSRPAASAPAGPPDARRPVGAGHAAA